eukprot:gene43022-53388_t
MNALEFIEKVEKMVVLLAISSETPEFKEDIGAAQKKGETLQWTPIDRGKEEEEFAGVGRALTKAKITHYDDPRNCETCCLAEIS